MTPLYVSIAVSVAGDGAFSVAVPLLAAAITTNPVAVGVVTACLPAPWLLVGLFAGALTDRWPRRRVMIVADLTRAALLSVFGLATATGHITIPALAFLVLLVGLATSFSTAPLRLPLLRS
jgi:MFS family permease